MPASSRTIWNAAFAVAVIAAAAIGSNVRASLEAGVRPDAPVLRPSALVASKDKAPAIAESDFFFNLLDQLKRTYVEPIKDDQKLAIGAVKGMVASLGDSHSYFMDAEEMRRHEAMLRGQFEGIGVELMYVYDEAARELGEAHPEKADISAFVPELVVSAVAPGGPADKAGLRPGDRIATVAGRWVLSPSSIMEFRELGRQIQQGKVDAEKIEEVRTRLREQSRNGMAPARAREELTKGATGTIKLSWTRGGETFEGSITRAKTQTPPISERPDGAITVRVLTGAAEDLRAKLAGRQSVALDLRNSTVGDYAELPKMLAVLAPAGDYGFMVDERGRTPKPLKVTQGAVNPPRYKLLVDRSTRGAAEVLALALSSAGKAQLSGSATAGERVFLETVRLQDGSGYTIPVARYRANLAGGGK